MVVFVSIPCKPSLNGFSSFLLNLRPFLKDSSVQLDVRVSAVYTHTHTHTHTQPSALEHTIIAQTCSSTLYVKEVFGA
jgi:hypothetical protein